MSDMNLRLMCHFSTNWSFRTFILFVCFSLKVIISLSILSSYGGSYARCLRNLFSAVFGESIRTGRRWFLAFGPNVYGFTLQPLVLFMWILVLGLLVSFIWGWFCGFIF